MTPRGWARSDLASVVATLQSGSRPKGGAGIDTGDIPSLGGENILQTGGITLSGIKLVPLAFFQKMTKGHLENGDVLINKDGAQTGKVGLYVSTTGGPACINEHLFLIRGRPDRIRQEYLYFTLLSEHGQRQIAAQISGSAQPGLTSTFLKAVAADIPDSLDEQAAIVHILLTIDQTIEQTAMLIAKQQRIKAGLLQDLLTRGIDQHGVVRSDKTHEFKESKVGAIPASWRCVPLVYFVPSAEYGISTSLGDSGEPVLRMNNLTDGEADLSELKYTNAPVPEHLWLRTGDVLFNRTNSWEHVGRTGIWRGQLKLATFASYLVRLNPDPDRLSSELLNLWLNWPKTQIRMRRYATPAVQQVNINPTNLRLLHAAFPTSRDEQAAIVDRIQRHNAAVRAARSTFNKLHALKRGLMQDLLSGRQAATVLLEPEPVRTRVA
jgi:type I restriction enzyme S subunit